MFIAVFALEYLLIQFLQLLCFQQNSMKVLPTTRAHIFTTLRLHLSLYATTTIYGFTPYLTTAHFRFIDHIATDRAGK